MNIPSLSFKPFKQNISHSWKGLYVKPFSSYDLAMQLKALMPSYELPAMQIKALVRPCDSS